MHGADLRDAANIIALRVKISVYQSYWLQVLASVQEAIEQPLYFKTPWLVQAEEKVTGKPLVCRPQEGEPRLAPDEIILRVEIREFDAMHHPVQVCAIPSTSKHAAAALLTKA